jgi:hypothetical protein
MSQKLGLKKRREQLMAALGCESNDSWAAVELYRWQHGELPPPTGSKPLDVPVALAKMAEALSQPDQKKWPAPFNVASVLAYAAKLLQDKC